jgi:uncharacterized Zn finger protein (UPF0148 family)
MSLIPQDWSARERQRARRVLQRRNPEQIIDADLCAAIRERAVDGATSADLRREIDAAAQTIRRHLRGLCDCDHDVAPVVWDATTQEWVREDDDELVTDGGRDLVRACPACDSPDVRVRPGGYNSGPGRLDGRRWRCKDCGATFDEPVERASKRSHAGLSGTARDLAEADPDDLRADGGGYPCALCNETHESLEAALQCCGDRLDEPNPDGDLWTCDRCGEFATERCRDDDGDYCLWCRERVDDRQRREADAEREVRPDGGFADPDAIDALERQADALETVAEQQRIQTAALAELIRTVDEVAAAADDHHRGRRDEGSRSGRSVAGWIEDAALEVAERVDLDAVDQHADEEIQL